MNILVIGGGGMVGVKLINRLARTASSAARRSQDHPPRCGALAAATRLELSHRNADRRSVGSGRGGEAGGAKPDVIFHLAAIVSGEAEAIFEKGYQINLDGTRYLFEAIRKAGGGYKPKVIFTSSIAVFGAPFPEAIPDDYFTTPLTSYGTQKAICELLLVGLFAARLLRWRRPALPDHLRASGQAQSRRLGFLLQHHPRAARRSGGGSARGRGRPSLACLAPRGHRLPHPCRDDGHGRARQPAAT